MAGPTLDGYLEIVSDIRKQENLEHCLIFKGKILDVSHFLGLKREDSEERVTYSRALKGLLGPIEARYYFVGFYGWTLLFVDKDEAAVHFKMKYGYGNYIRGELEFFESIKPPRPKITEPPS